MDAIILRDQRLTMINHQCKALIPELEATLGQSVATVLVHVCSICTIPLGPAHRLGIHRHHIEQLFGFQQLQRYCDDHEIHIDLAESVSEAEGYEALLDTMRSGDQPPTQFVLRVRWGEEPDELEEDCGFCREFRVVKDEQQDGFPLWEGDDVVLQNAQHFLTTILQRCTLPPEVRHLLQQMLTALTHLPHRIPEIAVECVLTLHRRSHDAASWRFWGHLLCNDRFRMYADGEVEGNFRFALLPYMEITIEANGQDSMHGNANEWRLLVEEMFERHPMVFKNPGITATLELLVTDYSTDTNITVALFPSDDAP